MVRPSTPLTKKEKAKKICYGVVITSVWLTLNGVLWYGLEQFTQRIKLVEDYGNEFMDYADLVDYPELEFLDY